MDWVTSSVLFRVTFPSGNFSVYSESKDANRYVPCLNVHSLHLGRQCPTTGLGKALQVTGAAAVEGRVGRELLHLPPQPWSLEILGSLRELAQR